MDVRTPLLSYQNYDLKCWRLRFLFTSPSICRVYTICSHRPFAHPLWSLGISFGVVRYSQSCAVVTQRSLRSNDHQPLRPSLKMQKARLSEIVISFLAAVDLSNCYYASNRQGGKVTRAIQ